MFAPSYPWVSPDSPTCPRRLMQGCVPSGCPRDIHCMESMYPQGALSVLEGISLLSRLATSSRVPSWPSVTTSVKWGW